MVGNARLLSLGLRNKYATHLHSLIKKKSQMCILRKYINPETIKKQTNKKPQPCSLTRSLSASTPPRGRRCVPAGRQVFSGQDAAAKNHPTESTSNRLRALAWHCGMPQGWPRLGLWGVFVKLLD